MKKFILALLICAMALSLASCGAPSVDPSPADSAEAPAEAQAKVEEPKEPEAKESWEIGDSKVVLWSDSIGSVWAQVSVPVTNTGSAPLYLGTTTVDLEDVDGNLVDSLQMVSAMPDYINPGETTYYFEVTTVDVSEDAQLKAITHTDPVAAKNDVIRFNVSDVSINDQEYQNGVEIIGRVENTSDEPSTMTYVVFDLFDADGNFICQNFTIITDEIAPADKISFTAICLSSPDSVSADTVASYEAYAYPLQMQF